MITFAITGGICCGKSTVTKTFLKHNIPVVDADVVARELVVPGSACLQEIVNAFGSDILLSNGTLDRIKLGSLVFQDPSCMGALNHIMGAAIENESARQLQTWYDKGHNLVAYDAALIVEMGHADKYRPLIVVYCSEVIQIERLMKRNALTRQQAMNRITAQMSTEQKVAVADYTICTDGTIEQSIIQAELIIKELKQMEYVI